MDSDEAPEGEKRFWGAYPADEIAYERFVEYVLRQAGLDPGETTAPHDGRSHMGFTNGVIDWDNEREDTPLLLGQAPGGWIDPSCWHVGSASREEDGREEIQEGPYYVQVDRRQFSLITLDVPTAIKGQQPWERSFYDRVVVPLVDLQRTPGDNLYGWLQVMFQFCAGKPFVYYSRYLPSPRIHALAAQLDVSLLHIPLGQIPPELLERNHTFRFMHLTETQWHDLATHMARQGLWGMVRNLQSHGVEPRIDREARASRGGPGT